MLVKNSLKHTLTKQNLPYPKTQSSRTLPNLDAPQRTLIYPKNIQKPNLTRLKTMKKYHSFVLKHQKNTLKHTLT